jgi:hypothetical protein
LDPRVLHVRVHGLVIGRQRPAVCDVLPTRSVG